MITKKTIIISLFAGVGITLITGLIPRRVLVGGTHYGWPMAWLVRLVLAPQYNPWKVIPVWLIVDVVLWSLVVFLLYNFILNR
jgi:hypothetical protein